MNRGLSNRESKTFELPAQGTDGLTSSSWLYNIPDTHELKVPTPHSIMSLKQIIMVTPPPAFHLHNARGHASF